jgi:hypothetical protein
MPKNIWTFGDPERTASQSVDNSSTAGGADAHASGTPSDHPETERFAAARGAAYLNDIQGFPDPCGAPLEVAWSAALRGS